ncbi:MAG: hypothetical protein IT204_10445 [Fimbriimonadaceae bacterium]|nr:hypothetical protein [Fimbriimonadaceae bacterium]
MTGLLLALLCGLAPAVREVDLTLPAGDLSIAVRLALPAAGRYGAVAPVAVQVPGGWGPGDRRRLAAPLAALGCVDLRFEFPAGTLSDLRGPRATAVLAQVIRFAQGDLAASDGRRLPQIAAPLQPAVRAVGLLGWDNGGNSAVLVLAEQDRAVQGVAWVATWETPVGDGAPTVLCGGLGDGALSAYDPLTGEVDWAVLRFAPGLALPGSGGLVYGAFYLDTNRDGQASPTDLVPAALPAPGGGALPRYVYPTGLLQAAAQRQLLPDWPAHLLRAAEAAEFWARRNAAGNFARAVVNRPELLAMVLGQEPDHQQAAPDHPHLWAAWSGWRAAAARWVRLNPDRAYLAAVAGEHAATWPELPAGTGIERWDLPRSLPPTTACDATQLACAAVAELADRVHQQRLDPDLAAVLQPVPPIRRPGLPP